MGKYNKALNSKKLYEIRNDLEKEFYSHKLFSLPSEEAAEIIFKKIGTAYRIVSFNESKLKKLVNADFSSFDLVDFFQESMYEVFRGLTLKIKKHQVYKKKSVTVDEVFDLLGKAYKLSLFKRYEIFHGRDIVKMSIQKNGMIKFNYINENNVKYNITYDSFFRGLERHSITEQAKLRGITDFAEAMDFAHRKIFQTDVDIKFEGFDLKDYEEFTVALNSIATEDMLTTVVIANESGFLRKNLTKWVKYISQYTELDGEIIKNIISYLTFDFSNERSDVSLSYFVPIENDLLFLPCFFNFQRLDANIFRLLNLKNENRFSTEQKKFEKHQIKQLKELLPNSFLITEGKKALPGVDLLIFNPIQNDLHVIELKFKIPINSPRDIFKLDRINMSEAIQQKEKAKNLVSKNVLAEYFGDKYIGKKPSSISYFILTNYSIGLGTKVDLPSPILLSEHYIRCMNSPMSNKMVNNALSRVDKGFPRKITNVYSKVSLFNTTFVFPSYQANYLKIKEYMNESWNLGVE